MKRLFLKGFTLAFPALFFIGSAASLPAATAQQTQNTSSAFQSAQTISDSLDYPWSLARSGNQILLTEKAGNIVMIANGQQRRYRLHTSDAIADEGGAGLLGMALSPDFAETGVAYFYHSCRNGSGLTNKVIQARFDGNAWRETRVLLAGIPGHRLYNGGRVAIGPDNYVYVTTGWTADRKRPQDLKSLAGKVLRMTLDGKAPPDNPSPGSLVYSYGHRNPQGMTWDAAGQLFVVEHGESGHDEINRIKPGANYGWPLAEGAEQREDLEPAWIESGRQSWAPSGAAIAGNDLFVAALGARALLVVDRQTGTVKPFYTSENRIRDVMPVGQDLYVITTNRSPRASGPSQDRLLRLTRTASSSQQSNTGESSP